MPALNQVQARVLRFEALEARIPAPQARPRCNLVEVPRIDDARESRFGVKPERSWRETPACNREDDSCRIAVRRWKEDAEGVRDYSKAGDPRFAVVAIALRATTARLTVDGECVHDGPVAAGLAALTPPGLAATVQFRGPCDILHLFVPRKRLFAMADDAADMAVLGGSVRPWVCAVDPVIERLAWLLLKGAPGETGVSSLYLEGIALAIVGRLLDCSRASESQSSRGLLKWRLKRVQDFIEDQLSERLSLADLARSAGLSRMHFAAQFRAATGMRPHEYVVRRRIQRAQEILLTTSMPLVEVALSVGFQTQAHFTTVFRRFLGETPGRWRHAQQLA